jgi:hypothetical protein
MLQSSCQCDGHKDKDVHTLALFDPQVYHAWYLRVDFPRLIPHSVLGFCVLHEVDVPLSSLCICTLVKGISINYCSVQQSTSARGRWTLFQDFNASR